MREVDNLLLTKSGEAVEKILKSYSTSKDDREKLINDLLTSPNPFEGTITINKDDTSINRKILEKYLAVLELSLESKSDNTEN